MHCSLKRSIVVSFLFVAASLCRADITGTTGNSTLIPRPADARTGNLVSQTQAYVWAEAQNFTLTSPLAVDINGPGTFKEANLSTSFIATGTHINSYSFSFETPDGSEGDVAGSITFSQPLLGVVASNNPDTHLDDSNFLGLGTLFTTGQKFSGLDGGEPVTVSADRLTFSYTLTVTSPGDRFRFITAVPEPGISASVLSVLLLARRRHRKS